MNRQATSRDRELLKNQIKLEEENKVLLAETNEFNRSLLNQLFVVAGGFITLSTALLVTHETLKAMSPTVRIFLGVAMFSALVSLGFGIAQFYFDIDFLRKRRKANEVVIAGIANRKINTLGSLKKRMNIQDKGGPKSKSWWIFIQFGFLFVSALCILLVTGFILFRAKSCEVVPITPCAVQGSK